MDAVYERRELCTGRREVVANGILNPDAPYSLALETRKNHQVVNQTNPAIPAAGVQLQIAALRAKHPSAIHRPVGPSSRYNCHGLTFGARRTGINEAKEVQKILIDDGYEDVPIANVIPGDTAVYAEAGDVSHSGIVMHLKQGVPWILSKWGDCHEVIHAVSDSPYTKATVKYYRLRK